MQFLDKYKIHILAFPFFLSMSFIYLNSNSQSLTPYVITTAGKYVVNGGASLSYTIGEPIVQTLYSSKNILTQGFQQPIDTLALWQDSSQAAINDIYSETPFSVEVYPNPFSNYVNLKVNGISNDNFTIELLNELGQECMLPVIIDFIAGANIYRINTGDLAMGIYILRIKSTHNNFFTSVKLNRTAYD
jgi:hypothetical protein